MIVIIAAVIGAVWGGWKAKARKGKTADILQYAVVHALLFAIVGLFATLILDRTVL